MNCAHECFVKRNLNVNCVGKNKTEVCHITIRNNSKRHTENKINARVINYLQLLDFALVACRLFAQALLRRRQLFLQLADQLVVLLDRLLKLVTLHGVYKTTNRHVITLSCFIIFILYV